MKIVNIIITVEILVLIFFIFRAIFIKKEELRKTLVDYLTIFGIIFGVTIYFNLAPQSVELSKSKRLQFSSPEAIQKISRKGRSKSGFFDYPDFYFSTYITNIGEIPIMQPVLQFSFDYESQNFHPNDGLTAYIFEGINTSIKDPTILEWENDSTSNYEIIRDWNEKDLYEITLPPILVNQSVSLIIGYSKLKNFDLYIKEKPNLDSLVLGKMHVKLLEKGEIIPDWKTNNSRIENYSNVKKEDFEFDSREMKFRILQSRY